MSAEVTATLPFATTATLSRGVAGPPPPVRALHPYNHPSHGAYRGLYTQRELRPVDVAVGRRGAADGPCAPPTRRRPNLRVVTPLAGRERAFYQGGQALSAPWLIDGVSIGRPRPLLRTVDQGKASLRRLLYELTWSTSTTSKGAWLDYHSPPRTTEACRTADQTAHITWRAAARGGPQPPLLGGEWRAMLHCHLQ